MQVFKAFMKVLRTRLSSVLPYIIVFLIISVMMSTMGGADEKFTATEMTVCIFDEDDTPESRALAELIAKDNELVELENDDDVILDSLYYTSVDMVLTISKGYSERLAAGETEGLLTTKHIHDSFAVAYMDQLLSEYVVTVDSYMAAGQDLSEAIASTERTLSQETEVTVVSEETMSNSEYFSNYFRYLPYIIISVMLNGLCPVLMVMARKDLRYRTNCSSIRLSSVSGQTFLASAAFVGAVWLIFMVAGVILNGGLFSGRAWLAVLNSLIFSLVAAFTAILVSSFDVSDNVVSLITQIIGLGMSFLCGIFVPMEMLSSGVLTAARFLPAYWYVRANNMISGVEAFSGRDVMLFMGIELAFALALAVITLLIRRMKYNRAESVTA
ncbi:MAG: ABC transporter permease [Ruminococcus sp.]|nr:ABC transporter permease [Ruminococcus sp.]